jgi:hypothetical protein
VAARCSGLWRFNNRGAVSGLHSFAADAIAFVYATHLTRLNGRSDCRAASRLLRPTMDRLCRDELGYCGSTDTANRRQHYGSVFGKVVS